MKRPYPRGAPCGGALTHCGGVKPRPWCRISATSRAPSNQHSTDNVRAASVFDAVSQRLTGSKLEPDQIVTGEPARGKLRDERTLPASLPAAEHGKQRLNRGVRLMNRTLVRRLVSGPSRSGAAPMPATSRRLDIGDERGSQRVFRRARKIW